ncbi:voltage gated chloride channel domain-containing protein, putative [Eimeria maxima]|uniref:Voltage gated chloride channel domain-containing protein, putative n=1 Tax=Eimeria maxima TaxID=5804 RepID=U6M7Y6_EIMMA|nr:voltage gated chloride channel domain-containing protein, putative [Eimeria maxima]CDJ57790.1 voltage gated chloride channel domain-containing protein, putative [Eimeria maxima]
MGDNEDSFALLQRKNAALQEQRRAVASSAAAAATEDTAAFSLLLDAEVLKQPSNPAAQQQQPGVHPNEECGLLQLKHTEQQRPSRLLLHSCILPTARAKVDASAEPQHEQPFQQPEQEHQHQHADSWDQEPSPWYPFNNSSINNGWQQQHPRGPQQALRLLLSCLAASPGFLLQQLLHHLVFLVQLLKLAVGQAAKLEIWILAAATGIATAAAAVYIQLSSEVIADFRGGLCRDSAFKSQTMCLAGVPKGFAGESPWHSWASLFGAEGVAADIVNFCGFFTVSVATATAAAAAVCAFAPQAAGSAYLLSLVFCLLVFLSAVLSRTEPSVPASPLEGPDPLGIADAKVFMSGLRDSSFLSPRVLTVKLLTLSLAVGSGLSLGKEGPMVHISCCLGFLLLSAARRAAVALPGVYKHLKQRAAAFAAAVALRLSAASHRSVAAPCFPPPAAQEAADVAEAAATVGATPKLHPLSVHHRRRLQGTAIKSRDNDEPLNAILLAACAAGVGCAFSAPIGGVLFAFEEMGGGLGGIHLPAEKEPAGAAAAMALAAVLFKVIHENLFSRCSADASADPLNMCVRASSSNSSGSNNNSSGIQGPAPSDAYRVDGGLALELCCVLFFKTILTVFSFGLMVPAGIFIPALTIGASYGRLMGLLMLRLRSVFTLAAAGGPSASPGAYALVGAVSFLGGVTQTNIALIVILIEVTKTSAALALPFLLSLAIAKLLSAQTQQGGFYAALIRFKKQPYFFHETQVCFDGLTAAEAMTRDLQVLSVEETPTVAGLKALAEKRLCGYMHAWQLRSLLQQLLQLEHPLVHAHTLVSFHAFRSSAAAVSAQQHQQHQRERAVRSSVCLLVLDEDGTLRQSFPLLHLAADGRLRVAAPSPAAASAASAQLERGHSEGNKSFSEGSSGAVEMQRLTCVSHPKELATTATETDAGEDAAVAAATGQCTAAGVQVYVDLSLLVDEEVLQLPPHTPLLQVYRLFGLLQCEVCLLSRCGVLVGLIGKKSFLTTMRTPQLDECC